MLKQRLPGCRICLRSASGSNNRSHPSREERVVASVFVQAAQPPSAGDLRALSLFTLGLEARTKTVREGLSRAEKSIAEQKQRLTRAQQDERALSQLREKRFAEWEFQAQREIETTAQELWLFSHTTNKDERV